MRITLSFFFIIIIRLVFGQASDAKLANEYFQQGEFDKALTLYQDLEKNKAAIPIIHANYLRLLMETKDTHAVEKYLRHVLKVYPNNLQYQVDQVHFYKSIGEEDKTRQILNDMIKTFEGNQYQLSSIAQQLLSKQMFDESERFYKKARQVSGRQSSFALDLAALYRLVDKKMEMTQEYINYAEGNPANIAYVKNLFQNILTEPEDQNYLEQILIEKIQHNPNDPLYPDLLIWLELQRKNFYAAFVQARALDKRTKQPGDESMRIARIAYENESWQDAIEIYQYVIDNYQDSYNYPTARRFLIKSKESLTKTKYPIDTTAIRNLAGEYASLYKDIGPNPTSLEALRNEALLHAFYLNELDTAVSILNFIIQNRRSPGNLVAESKLDLGDIYLLLDQPWESTLLYSQVEKAHKESQLAYDAKLRNAKLNYFTGNFSLAKSHLDILKLATTRTISNDAIALSLLISDNTAFDTTDVVMKEFASAELLIFTNHKEEAKEKLNHILADYPGHSVVDEIYWLEAKLALEEGDAVGAVQILDKIIQQFNYDILSDDAFFRKAVIIQEYLHEDQQAQELYQEFLKKYPGSRHAAEARSRFRKIRGDLTN